MDLTHFMGSEVQKDFFKVTFIAGNEKIKRFVKATSKHHAKSIMETQLRADFSGKICKILEIKELVKNGTNVSC